MKTIQTVVNVTPDGKITIELPSDIPAGEYQAVIVIDEQMLSESSLEQKKIKTLQFSTYPVGLVDKDFTFRREDLYE